MKSKAIITLCIVLSFGAGLFINNISAKHLTKSKIQPIQLENKPIDESVKLGAFSLSLNVKDLKVSKQFYENLGFKVLAGDFKMNYFIMKNENALIGIFQGMFEKNIITFNPGWDENGKNTEGFMDIREIQKVLKGKGIKLDTEVDEKTEGPGSVVLNDPDGNMILLDQHR